MQIVIDVPDWVYKHIVKGNEEAPDENISIDAIRNGTVLPENHGRLVDANELIKKTNKSRDIYGELWKAPTILEATEGKE